MTLIKSISGIRGTIGGKVGDGLTPLDTVKFSAAYGAWLKKRNKGKDEWWERERISQPDQREGRRGVEEGEGTKEKVKKNDEKMKEKRIEKE